MTRRTRVLAAVLFLISLPALLVAIEAVAYQAANRNNGTLVSSSEKREYLVYVPPSYDRTKPTPLVISMHGAGGWPAFQRETSEWNQVADREGFIVVYPSGIGGGRPRVWHVNGASGQRDVRFISDLIDTLKAAYNIDSARVYANGLSNGAGMAFVLSCTMSDRIAAVGLVSAALLLPWNWCTDLRPVPMIAFHGTADPVTPYTGGLTWVAPSMFPSIATWTANWAGRNRCGQTPTEAAVAEDVTRFEYRNCADDAAVVLYRMQGAGHEWPGGGPLPEWLVGPASSGVDATSQMWAFFREHRLTID